jgi:diaminohydroxyphosphoribosylaminopyrimidine deaminase/5-amino-6-(5-phosphoribosylamino)uracil reductase
VSLAWETRGDVEPNPPVGAVVLAGHEVLGEGWHRAYGGPHAEVDALKDAGEAARGATLVVTLEPCSTTGKTPPCVEAVMEAGITRVVVGAVDPDPRHGGRGLQLLGDAGVDVTLCTDPASADLLTDFHASLARRRPHVMLKWAMSADGAIAGSKGEPVQLTGALSSARVHRWRAHLDGILVGVQTVLNDDPMLTARGALAAVRPLRRIVLDPELRLPITCRLADTAGETPTWVLADVDADEQPETALEATGVRVLRVPRHGESWLADALSLLRVEGVARLMVEGGARTLSSFLEAGLVDQLAVFQCPKILGRDALPALPGRELGGLSPEQLAEALGLSDVRVETLGDDTLLRGIVTA